MVTGETIREVLQFFLYDASVLIKQARVKRVKDIVEALAETWCTKTASELKSLL